MDIKPIKTDADYRVALEEIKTLMMAKADSLEGEKLDVLVTLLEAYEAKHFPLDFLKGSVLKYEAATAPVAGDDWENAF